MKIFVTGAAGYIGNAVAEAFRLAGHTVMGLVRSEAKANQLRKAEIIPIIGQLENPETYAKAANNAEVIIHCAADPSPKRLEIESIAVDFFLNELKGSSRTFIYTSGVWSIGNTGSSPVDET